MSVPETLARGRMEAIIEGEFTALNPPLLTVENDKLGRSAGRDGNNHVTVIPVRSRERPNVQVLRFEGQVQLYLAYRADPDETIVVDPAVIEALGNRLRRACRTQSSGNVSDMWYIRLTGIEYPDDPTGNKSRLEADFIAECDNPAGQH